MDRTRQLDRPLRLPLAVLALVAVPATVTAAAPAAGESPAEQDTAAVYTNRVRFNVGYEAPKDVARVRLWITTDGGAAWKPYGYDGDCASPAGVKVDADGTYGFYVSLEDAAGHAKSAPADGARPELVVVVDTAPPEVELLGPRGGFFGSAGASSRRRPVRVEWRAWDEYASGKCVAVEVSTDGGKTWTAAAIDLPATGAWDWRPAKDSTEVRTVRFRVSARDRAGNSASAESKMDVRLDDEPPVVRATGCSPGRPAGVAVAWETLDPGGAGVESVRLYFSTDGGDTWTEDAFDGDGESPIEWTPERSATCGIYLAGTDRAGNAAPGPVPGAAPQLAAVQVRVGPGVALVSPSGPGPYKGGDAISVRWEATGTDLPEESVSVEFSLDGGATWKPVAADQPPAGAFEWTLPKTDTEQALVRVTACNARGDVGCAISARPFAIDSTPPEAVVGFDPDAQVEAEPLAVDAPPPLRLPPEPAPGPPAPAEIKLAREHLEARRYAEAIAALTPLLERAPLDARANLLLGTARAREPDRLDGEGKLGIAELLRRYERATGAFATAARAASSVKPAHAKEAVFWLGMCRYRRARVMYERLRRARAAAEEGALATRRYESALKAAPNTPDELYHAGIAYHLRAAASPAKERPPLLDRARELLEQSLVGASGAVAGRARWYLADFAARRGDTKEATAQAREALVLLGERSPSAARLRAIIAAGGR